MDALLLLCKTVRLEKVDEHANVKALHQNLNTILEHSFIYQLVVRLKYQAVLELFALHSVYRSLNLTLVAGSE